MMPLVSFIFQTDPSEPRDLTVNVISSTELEVKWKPPKFPNGNVTHYKVAYLRQTIDSEAYVQRNYCDDRKCLFFFFFKVF